MKYKIEFTVDIKNNADYEDVEEWIKFELGAAESMESTNRMAFLTLVSQHVESVTVKSYGH